MDKEKETSCKNCKYWNIYKSANTGYLDDEGEEIYGGVCKKNAPEGEGFFGTGFPRTNSDDWCGEYKPKK